MAEYYIGLISGTSMDGIDAVVVDFSAPSPVLLAARTLEFDPELRTQLDRVRADPDNFPTGHLAQLDARLGDALAEAARTITAEAGLAAKDIRAIGSHGQTIVHRADADPPYTLQIGDPHRISAGTGITTVADFRRADLAAGGHGAPLAPLLHHALLRSDEENRVVVNLGGIANITLLPATGGVTGFDTGPANCFLDLWYRRHHEQRFDSEGEWGSGGRVDKALLGRLLDDPYFSSPAPKSTGIEYFSAAWLDRHLPDWSEDRPQDIQSTLAAFSARSLTDAIKASSCPAPDRLIVCGGGVGNADLMSRIGQHLPGTPVQSSAAFGIDPDALEAMLFAWLARERLAGRPVETPPITGSARPVLAGTIHKA